MNNDEEGHNHKAALTSRDEELHRIVTLLSSGRKNVLQLLIIFYGDPYRNCLADEFLDQSGAVLEVLCDHFDILPKSEDLFQMACLTLQRSVHLGRLPSILEEENNITPQQSVSSVIF